MRECNETFIRIYETAYSNDYCDKVISTWDTLGLRDNETQNHDWSDNNHRRDKAVFIDEVLSEDHYSLQKSICDTFFNVVKDKTNKYLKDLGIWKEVELVPDGMKVQKYDHKRSGGYYVFHSEQHNRSQRELRRHLTYTLYLNDIPEGEGETEFLFQGIRYQPKKGDLVIFPAFFTHTHRGNPVYTTDKYIATGWMLWANRPLEEKENND